MTEGKAAKYPSSPQIGEGAALPTMPLSKEAGSYYNAQAASSTPLPGVRRTPSKPALAKKQSTRNLAMMTPPNGVNSDGEEGNKDGMSTPELFNSLSRSAFGPPDGSPTPIRHPRSQASLMRSRENFAPAASSVRPPTSQQHNRRPLTIPRPTPLARPQVFHTTSIFNDRFQETPSLPAAWSSAHDRAICVLDARNYSLSAIVVKMKRTFPELAGMTLTPAMVDKRLRILDQRVELDYWAIGLRGLSGGGGSGGKDRVGFNVGEGSLSVPYGGHRG